MIGEVLKISFVLYNLFTNDKFAVWKDKVDSNYIVN